MSTDGALQYIDKTLSNLAENADDILWVNPEVVELVMDIRKALTSGEPSDAQVLAAISAYMPLTATPTLDDYHPSKVEAMRGALRAARGA